MTRKIAVFCMTAGLGFAASNSPVGTAVGRASFSVQGVEVPAAGGAGIPIMAGDVIQAKSGVVELRLTDGRRVIIPPSGRFVVGPNLARAGVTTPATRAAFAFNNGSIIAPSNVTKSASSASLAPTPNDATTPPNFTLPNVLALYGGQSSPLVQTIDQLISDYQSNVQVKLTDSKFYITGVSANVNGQVTPVTIVVTTTGITFLPGTISPSNPNPPAPLVNFTPPPPGGPPIGCNGLVVTSATKGGCN